MRRSKTLEDRLNAVRDELVSINNVCMQDSSSTKSLPSSLNKCIRKITEFHDSIDSLIDLINMRKESLESIKELNIDINEPDALKKFHNRQHMRISTYLVCAWAISDQISAFAGRVFLNADTQYNTPDSAQLVKSFINAKEVDSKKTDITKISLNEKFGEKIRLFYALRNYFFHDGGHNLGDSFFTSPHPELPHRISETGWTSIVKKSGIKDSPQRPDDMCEFLEGCEEAMDQALGVLLRSASGFLKIHIALLAGEG